MPSGQGSPCLDLRRVSDTLADATVGTDLVIIEGMGRAIHTNLRCVNALLRCPLSRPCASVQNTDPSCVIALHSATTCAQVRMF